MEGRQRPKGFIRGCKGIGSRKSRGSAEALQVQGGGTPEARGSAEALQIQGGGRQRPEAQ